MEDIEEVQVDDTTTETHQEVTDESVDDVKEGQAEEAVDELGVPLKNREAEATRKARKADRMSQSAAEKALISGSGVEEAGGDQEDAIRIVSAIAEQKTRQALEPILAKQFLLENPDARDMIEDINRVRTSYPELAGIDKLEVAYKIAKADRQDEIIRQRVESEHRAKQETLNKSKQASLEGTGRTKSGDSTQTAAEQIAGATSLEELQKLEDSLLK
jgi:hypothetical protein